MQFKSISRELALLLLGQIKKNDINKINIEILLGKAIESLTQHWREQLDFCASKLEKANQDLLDSELQDDAGLLNKSRDYLKTCLIDSENILNSLSDSIELPRLLALGDQKEIRELALKRVHLVIEKQDEIDSNLDCVMEGWRLKRLPRIDRDILRLALVDLIDFNTPTAVTCNEAVNLANRYSDEQGRRMINGVLRKLQDSALKLN
ncbi:transcription antitermination factor NusB [Prochlorococcus marinus]|uniref:Transcription antitermination factor NusB n=1 Tax=Prochlorococcus marinus XMU1408 TaxID=2213228 RepID=A0A318R6I0_PROMR|nr:transcription antitermination factor NusB [Prochlorococcus marinus]MBW3042988.1 transcription antitermination factor NusB [Prochlorococcus marinus str. XMU1408]PYE03617.1 transcription antitermination factor NusB [Prochlorococcus marinus XMU1408]